MVKSLKLGWTPCRPKNWISANRPPCPLTDGATIADTLVDGGESPADVAEAREQGAAIVAILHKNPSDTARAAERYLIRELGLPTQRPRQISAAAKLRLKYVAAGKGLGNCRESMGAILEEIETAARILANRETIAAASPALPDFANSPGVFATPSMRCSQRQPTGLSFRWTAPRLPGIPQGSPEVCS